MRLHRPLFQFEPSGSESLTHYIVICKYYHSIGQSRELSGLGAHRSSFTSVARTARSFVPAFLQTLWLTTAVLGTIGVVPRTYVGPCSSLPPTLKVGCLPVDLPTRVTVSRIAAQREADSTPEATAPAMVRSNTTAIPQAPFLRRPIWFDPNSLELNSQATDALHRDASWLKVHGESRILIVGSCDKSGSESCTHALAEARGTAVKKFLESCGVSPDQIVGVKGWDIADHDCRPGDSKCQQQGRSTQLLLAPPASK